MKGMLIFFVGNELTSVLCNKLDERGYSNNSFGFREPTQEKKSMDKKGGSIVIIKLIRINFFWKG